MHLPLLSLSSQTLLLSLYSSLAGLPVILVSTSPSPPTSSFSINLLPSLTYLPWLLHCSVLLSLRNSSGSFFAAIQRSKVLSLRLIGTQFPWYLPTYVCSSNHSDRKHKKVRGWVGFSLFPPSSGCLHTNGYLNTRKHPLAETRSGWGLEGTPSLQLVANSLPSAIPSIPSTQYDPVLPITAYYLPITRCRPLEGGL